MWKIFVLLAAAGACLAQTYEPTTDAKCICEPRNCHAVSCVQNQVWSYFFIRKMES